MPHTIPNRYYDIQSPVLCGDKKDHLLQPYHASMHAEVTVCNVAFPDGLLLVTSKSPKPYKQAVERIAWFFKREMRYDFPQYAATEYDRSPYSDQKTDADLRAFLWFEDEHSDRAANEWPMIGAAAFRFKGSKKKQLWFFDWVWIHPYERRQGHLERTWPFLCGMFGDFALTEPVSYSMQSFLVKMNQKDENPDD